MIVQHLLGLHDRPAEWLDVHLTGAAITKPLWRPCAAPLLKPGSTSSSTTLMDQVPTPSHSTQLQLPF